LMEIKRFASKSDLNERQIFNESIVEKKAMGNSIGTKKTSLIES